MHLAKLQHLQTVRSDSAYPVYRGVIGTVTLLWYLLAVLVGMTALIAGGLAYRWSGGLAFMVVAVGVVFAVLVFLFARMSKEGALMVADLADSTLDAGSRR